MTRPGMPANSLPPNNASMMRRIQDLERGFKMLQGARTLENASIGAGGLQVNNNGDIVVNGGRFLLKDASGNVIATLDDTGITVAGQETVQGTLTVTGDTAIEGTLSLPNGIIDNAALAAPVAPTVYNGSVSGGNGSASWTVGVSGDITIPSGYTQALVHVTVTAGASAVAGGGTYVSVVPTIAGTDGDTTSTWVPAGFGASVAGSFARLVTGLVSGGSLNVRVSYSHSSAANVTAGSANAHLSAIVLFLR